MKHYGIELTLGSQFKNLVVESVNVLPTEDNTAGRLLFDNTNDTLNLWTGTHWLTIASNDLTVVRNFNTRNGNVTLLASDLDGLINATNLPKATSSVLGAIKVGSGLTVDVNGVLAVVPSTAGDLPAGTRMLFAQPTAPIGWVQDNTDKTSNRMLRVVNSGSGTPGNDTGGVNDPILMDVVPSHTHVVNPAVVTSSSAGAHTHTYTDRYYVENAAYTSGGPNIAVPTGRGSEATDYDNNLARYITDTTGPASPLHTHTVDIPSTTTSANSGSNNWRPRFLNLIVCTKT